NGTVEIIETAWTKAAAEREEKLTEESLQKNPKGPPRYALPELRVYDPQQRLILHEVGISPGKTAAALDDRISSGRPINGPSLQATLADLETRDHRPAAERIRKGGRITIVDYWAEWCVPCKALEKELVAWAAEQPGGTVQLVRAEADLMKLARASGDKVIMMKKDASGKLVKQEVN
ncbi:MAG TPA: thioredoxin domain-containing protein, partial [Sphingomicrobium sp.]